MTAEQVFVDEALARALARKRVHRLARSGLLPERLEAVGLTQVDVARALKVHQSTVSRWLDNTCRPRPQHAVALLELLDLMDPQEVA